MQYLRKIIVSDFRNIALAELDFSPNVNCVSGNNGEGKTNLLDAIYYLSMTKSSFAGSDKYNFRYGTDSFSISGSYQMNDGLVSRFAVQVAASGEKKLRRDDKQYKKVSDHIGILPIVLVSPADTNLVSESGEERRRFVNAVLSQMDSAYLHSLQQYNRFLAQRNKLLKEQNPEPGLLDVLSARMAALAREIYRSRKEFSANILPLLQNYYSLISGGKEEVGLSYSTDLDKAAPEELLERTRQKDIMLGYTSTGIQRDDFIFSLNGHPIRSCGSQGQQKSFLVALKFAQYELLLKEYGFPPILLLDDVFDKLDPGRISNLLKMVAGQDFGQIFITDSNKVRMQAIVDEITSDRTYYEAGAGQFKALEVGREQ